VQAHPTLRSSAYLRRNIIRLGANQGGLAPRTSGANSRIMHHFGEAIPIHRLWSAEVVFVEAFGFLGGDCRANLPPDFAVPPFEQFSPTA
jgi:hypothetical protein